MHNMEKYTLPKALLITVAYYALTSILSLIFYLSFGEYVISTKPALIVFIDTLIYVISLIAAILFLKRISIHNFTYRTIRFDYRVFLVLIFLGIFYRLFIDPLYRINIINGNNNIPQITEQDIGSYKVIAMILNTIILLPILEEIIFRGIILKSLLKTKKAYLAILVSSVLFALIHISYYPLNFNYIIVINAFVISIITSHVYIKYGLFYSILFHSVLNFISFAINSYFQNEYWTSIKTLDFGIVYWGICILSFITIILFVLKVHRQKI